MKYLMTILAALLVTQVGCDEKNPYAGSQTTGSLNAAEGEGENINAGNTQESNGGEVVVEDSDEAVVAEDLSEEAKAVTDIICSSEANFSDSAGAFGIACANGQPTVALANALENPYNGQGDATINLLQSDDVNSVSQFKVITSLVVPKTPDEIRALSEQLNAADFTVGNASVTSAQISATPGVAPILEVTEVEFNLTVSVSIITVQDERLLEQKYILLDEATGVAGISTYLKAGETVNEDNIIASQITLIVPNDDGTTTMISMSQQHADNRGRHPDAEAAFTGVALQTMLNAYATLTQ